MSSIRLLFVVLLLLFFSSSLNAQSTAPAKTGAGAAQAARDPRTLFEAGESALHAGKLDEAERDFRQVLTINPEVAGAYANLGVIHMRRKQWPQAKVWSGLADPRAREWDSFPETRRPRWGGRFSGRFPRS